MDKSKQAEPKEDRMKSDAQISTVLKPHLYDHNHNKLVLESTNEESSEVSLQSFVWYRGLT